MATKKSKSENKFRAEVQDKRKKNEAQERERVSKGRKELGKYKKGKK